MGSPDRWLHESQRGRSDYLDIFHEIKWGDAVPYGGILAEGLSAAEQDVSIFQGKWKSSQRVRQGKGGFLGQPGMLSHWSSSVLREG